MLKTIRKMFEQFASEQPTPISPQLALAVLLCEVANADMNIDLDEHSALHKILASSFDLSSVQADELLNQAKIEQQESISLQTFTRVLTQNLDRDGRINFIQSMWQIAYADGELDGHEEYIIRKIADLVYLSHSDFIKAKLQAQP